MTHALLRFCYETFDALGGFAIDHDLFTLAVRWGCDLPERRLLELLDSNQIMVNPQRVWRLIRSVIPHKMGQSRPDMALPWMDIPVRNDGYHMGKSVTITWLWVGQKPQVSSFFANWSFSARTSDAPRNG